ncbi:MAG: carbohydrate ABC transporter permease [Blautia sp.]
MKKSGNRKLYTVTDPKKSGMLTFFAFLFCVYSLLPYLWLFINATKTQKDFASTFGLSFGESFALWDNIVQVFTYHDGIFVKWLLNSVFYTVVGSVVSTLLATLAGYALAKLRFSGKRAVLLVILGAISVPGIALAIPQFLLFSKIGITNTVWAVLVPSFVSPFGVYLMWIFSGQAVPSGLLEAAEIDGSGPWRTFFKISLPLLAPALVTVFLFAFVSIWNNFFLPLIMLKNTDLYPLTMGLYQWNLLGSSAGGSGEMIQNLVLAGALLTILPLIIAFLCLQKYWQSGLALGAEKG